MTSAASIPSVRSRLWASGTSFVLGFALANYGILMVARPDQWLWIVAAVVLMLTGAIGILFADTGRAVSIWSILGIEIFTVFTAIPLLWTFTLATTPDGVTAQTLWPQDVSWAAFNSVLHDGPIRHAAATSAIVAGLATAVSIPLALGAGYALARLPLRGRRVAYAVVVAVLLAPVIALAGPMTDHLIAFGRDDSRLALVPPTLVLTLPLAIWLCVTLFRDAPWTLAEAMRADGATRWQMVRRFGVPYLGIGVLAATLLVFVVGCSDFVLGATLPAGDANRTLPATLLLSTGELDDPTAVIAAAGLLWLVPAVIILLAFPRRISQLLGRSYR